MDGHTTISAQNRKKAGKENVNAHRSNGQTPGVVYGGTKKPVHLNIEGKILKSELQKGNFFSKLYTVDIEGNIETVVPRDIQYHPVTDQPLHIDFLRVTENTRIAVNVNVQFENDTDSPGIKKGGVLNVVRRSVELSCKAASIPEYIIASLSGLEIGDSIRISNIDLPDGTKPIIKRDFIIATIAAPTVVQEEETASESYSDTASETETETEADKTSSDTEKKKED